MIALLRAVSIGALLLCAACAQQDAAPAPELVAPSAGQWVLDIEGVHARVDGAIATGDRAAARHHIEAALSATVPTGVSAEHRRVVHQDLLFRLAGVELSASGGEAALRASERGLALGRFDDLFTANLLLSAGRALETLGRDTEAADSYYRALKINEALLSRVLATDAGAP